MFKLFKKKKKSGKDLDTSDNSETGQGDSEYRKEDFGLFTLTSVEEFDVDIVAVHGLGGHWERTWTHSECGKLWLRDFLPSSFPSARVMSYGYNSMTAFSKSVSDIEQVATVLLDRLRGERSNDRDMDKPIIFISHSLGGIIVKKALIIAHERDSIYGKMLEKVQGLMFFAVPHRGADVAYWGSFAASICRFATIGLTTNPKFVNSLQRNSKELASIAKQFIERSKGLRIRTYYETQRIGGQLIVDEESARLNIREEIPAPMQGADHISICKFPDIESQNYKQVLAGISELSRSVEIASV